MSDRVSVALVGVDQDFYWKDPDGAPVHQVTVPHLIARMLRLLDVPEGTQVLEVGTGSGYSTALLSSLAGPSGAVISLDIDPEMVERASRLLRQDGRHNVTVMESDGRNGHPPGAPYDRLVAWASADQGIPEPWVDQVRVGGFIFARLRALLLTQET